MPFLKNYKFKNREEFFHYVNECNRLYSHGHDLSLYRDLIQMHHNTDSLESLLTDDKFYDVIYDTLCAFGMNQQGARLRRPDQMRQSIKFWKKQLIELYKYKIFLIPSMKEYAVVPPSNQEDRIGYDIMALLRKVFCGLEVMESNRRIVGVSKALHFILPDLVIPMDGRYTMFWFFRNNVFQKTPLDEFNKIFKVIFLEFYNEIRRLRLTQEDVDNDGWNASVPKLYDSAIIGFCQSSLVIQ